MNQISSLQTVIYGMRFVVKSGSNFLPIMFTTCPVKNCDCLLPSVSENFNFLENTLTVCIPVLVGVNVPVLIILLTNDKYFISSGLSRRVNSKCVNNFFCGGAKSFTASTFGHTSTSCLFSVSCMNSMNIFRIISCVSSLSPNINTSQSYPPRTVSGATPAGSVMIPINNLSRYGETIASRNNLAPPITNTSETGADDSWEFSYINFARSIAAAKLFTYNTPSPAAASISLGENALALTTMLILSGNAFPIDSNVLRPIITIFLFFFVDRVLFTNHFISTGHFHGLLLSLLIPPYMSVHAIIDMLNLFIL